MIKLSKIKYVIRYFVKNYPYSDELSKTRITKMVYLADWYYALENEKQITNIKWYFDHYGPYVSDVFEIAQNDSKLKIVNSYSAFGSPKQIVAFSKPHTKSVFNRLSEKEELILQKVIEDTKFLTWTAFIDLVYSTYPIKTQKRYTYLDLESLAREYND